MDEDKRSLRGKVDRICWWIAGETVTGWVEKLNLQIRPKEQLKQMRDYRQTEEYGFMESQRRE